MATERDRPRNLADADVKLIESIRVRERQYTQVDMYRPLFVNKSIPQDRSTVVVPLEDDRKTVVVDEATKQKNQFRFDEDPAGKRKLVWFVNAVILRPRLRRIDNKLIRGASWSIKGEGLGTDPAGRNNKEKVAKNFPKNIVPTGGDPNNPNEPGEGGITPTESGGSGKGGVTYSGDPRNMTKEGQPLTDGGSTDVESGGSIVPTGTGNRGNGWTGGRREWSIASGGPPTPTEENDHLKRLRAP